MKKIRILIADDHAIVRAGLSAVLGFEDDMEIVGEAEDGRQAVEAARTLHPDVVIMDLSMPILDGAAATAAILREQPGARVLILTTYGTSADVTRAVKSGAAGAVSKTLPNEELTAAIRSVAMGEGAFSPDVRRMLADAGRNAARSRARSAGSSASSWTFSGQSAWANWPKRSTNGRRNAS